MKSELFFNLLECMNIGISEEDKTTIKRECLSMEGKIKYKRALEILKIEEVGNTPQDAYGKAESP